MSVTATLKPKWRMPFTSPRHSYRSRTGLACCNANCGRQRKTINGGKPSKGAVAVNIRRGAK